MIFLVASVSNSKHQFLKFLITQVAYVFVFGMVACSEANLFIKESNIKVLEIIDRLPPNNNGVYFLFIAAFLLIANIVAMSLFTIEIAIKKKYFPNKLLGNTKNWINTLAIITPVYLLVIVFYLELIFKILNAVGWVSFINPTAMVK